MNKVVNGHPIYPCDYKTLTENNIVIPTEPQIYCVNKMFQIILIKE